MQRGGFGEWTLSHSSKGGVVHRRWYRLPSEVRRQVIRLAAQGATYAQILEQVDVSMGTVANVLRPFGGVFRGRDWDPPQQGRVRRRLSLEERVAIRIGIERGRSFSAIAAELGRPTSTISREVGGRAGRDCYQPVPAHHRAGHQARRPKLPKLIANPVLAARVGADLRQLWSPQQIASRLRSEFGHDRSMTVSHETIYQSIYVQGRGALRKELAACLRTGRARRHPHTRLDTPRPGVLTNMVMISERPAEADDRAVPGHWEGDLIMGAGNRSAIGTLVERTTRFVMFLHLPGGRHTADVVRDAMTTKILTPPTAMRRSITWDQGKEMAQHAQFTIDTGIQIYFCDPHSPWMRGSNENTNGLARQYFPKSTNLTKYTEADLAAAADSLNGRPRQTLGWMTPSEKLAQLLIASSG
jgi:transposase, IS30 family